MSNFAPSVGNAIKIIEQLSNETEAVGVSYISRSLGMNKNLVFRILNSLEQEGWVFSDRSADNKYKLSLVPFQISSKVVSKLSLNSVATPYIYNLWKQTGESTYLGILKDEKVMYIQHLDSTRDIKVAGVVGGMYDLYCSAPGKVILAFAGEKFINEYLESSFKKRTENTLTDIDELREEIEKIRLKGYALDNEEFSKGIVCFAAPVFDYTGTVIGTVGCSLSTVICDADSIMDRCGKLVIGTANEISKCMGKLSR